MKIEEECQRLIFRLLRKQLIGQKSGSDNPCAGKVLYHWCAGKKKLHLTIHFHNRVAPFFTFREIITFTVRIS